MRLRRCRTANSWVGAALAARMMGLKEAWNAWYRSWFPWHAAMWDAYRPNY